MRPTKLVLVLVSLWSGAALSQQTLPSRVEPSPKAAVQVDNWGTEASPLIKGFPPPPLSEEETKRREREVQEKAANDERLTNYTSWLAVFTALLMFIALAQAGLFYWQLVLIRKTVGDSKKAAAAAADNAAAATQLVAASRRAEAPYLLPELYELPEPSQEGKPGRPNATYKLANEGKSVGVLLYFQDALRFLLHPLPEDPDALFDGRWEERKEQYIPIGPGRVERGIEHQFHCVVFAEDRPNLRAPEGAFYLLGRIQYADLFDARHEQRFCWRIDAKGRINRAGGPLYNYDQQIA